MNKTVLFYILPILFSTFNVSFVCNLAICGVKNFIDFFLTSSFIHMKYDTSKSVITVKKSTCVSLTYIPFYDEISGYIDILIR